MEKSFNNQKCSIFGTNSRKFELFVRRLNRKKHVPNNLSWWKILLITEKYSIFGRNSRNG